jgi:hypothetical protein
MYVSFFLMASVPFVLAQFYDPSGTVQPAGRDAVPTILASSGAFSAFKAIQPTVAGQIGVNAVSVANLPVQ